MPTEKPRWKAMFCISVNKTNVPTLGDTGCSRSCMSETFFREHPHLQYSDFRPYYFNGTAINGTKVLTLGLVNLQFRIDGVHMRMNMRIVRGLITPVVLGWDFFSKYGAHLDPSKGQLIFMNDKSAPLIPDTAYFRMLL